MNKERKKQMFQKQCWVIKKNSEVCEGDEDKEEHCQMYKKQNKTGTK